jgi:hypothetical protein
MDMEEDENIFSAASMANRFPPRLEDGCQCFIKNVVSDDKTGACLASGKVGDEIPCLQVAIVAAIVKSHEKGGIGKEGLPHAPDLP